MINTSNNYKKAIEKNRVWWSKIDLTTKSGSKLGIDHSKIVALSINEATSSSGKFEIGAAVIKELDITIDNSDGMFDEIDFEKADMLVQVALEIDAETHQYEWIRKGLYRIVEAKSTEITINIKAYDSMLFFDKDFADCSITFPTTVSALVQRLCTDCGITYDARTVEQSSFRVKSRPKGNDLTYRDVLSYCAQIMGCYARITNLDRLAFGWYPFENLEVSTDGGVFDKTTSSIYQTGAELDGGLLSDYENGDSCDAGSFTVPRNYHHFYDLLSQSINTDDIVVTGVRVSEKESGGNEKIWSSLYGSEGYVLEIVENPLISSETAAGVAKYVGDKIIGKAFRPLDISCKSDPCIEAGDVALVTDRHQRTYQTVITNTTFGFGGQKVECSAETPTEKNYTKFGASTRLIRKTGDAMDGRIDAYDAAVQNMNQLAANTFGFYATQVRLEDGTRISYRHDKPQLAESKVVYKSNMDGFYVTTDYQGSDEATTAAKKWQSGLDANGNAVVNVLSAIGLNADWIETGSIRSKDGSVEINLDENTINIKGITSFDAFVGKDDLKTAGKTIINGSNITTGIIKDAGSNTVINLTTGAITINKGSINIGDGAFKVGTTGALTAKKATIEGSITSSGNVDERDVKVSIKNGEILGQSSGSTAGRIIMRHPDIYVEDWGPKPGMEVRGNGYLTLYGGGTTVSLSRVGVEASAKEMWIHASSQLFINAGNKLDIIAGNKTVTLSSSGFDPGGYSLPTVQIPTSIADDGTVNTWSTMKLVNGILT